MHAGSALGQSGEASRTPGRPPGAGSRCSGRHFQSIREVTKQPGFYLIEKAAARFEAARTAFETAHPGYTFPSTDTATQMRGFHQARQGIGMLGHALGVAFDLLAYDNPNQKLGETAHFGYLLDKFGGQGDKRGRSVMNLGAGADDKISAMGQEYGGQQAVGRR